MAFSTFTIFPTIDPLTALLQNASSVWDSIRILLILQLYPMSHHGLRKTLRFPWVFESKCKHFKLNTPKLYFDWIVLGQVYSYEPLICGQVDRVLGWPHLASGVCPSRVRLLAEREIVSHSAWLWLTTVTSSRASYSSGIFEINFFLHTDRFSNLA